MHGTLFVVATPIGNLEDITLRALRVLREVDLIAAEDTRRTAKLLTHHGISTPTLSFHEHNTRARIPQLLGSLADGRAVALVTDAGTPGVSDPGVRLVQACLEKGIPIDPVPGVSAPLTAAIASGFPLDPLTIFGFAPHRSKDRKEWLRRIAAIQHTVTFFESPHRIEAMLLDAQDVFGDRPIMLGRELTKVHQEFIRGTSADVARDLTTPRGELTVVVGPNIAATPVPALVDDRQILTEFGLMTESSRDTRRQVISGVARKLGTSARLVYAAVERAKKSVE
jgi:16S rRNA (cytidine1402-2'-O)-methyltransferase